jgi:hypothetical protein
MAQQSKKKQGKTLADIGGVHSLFSSGNEAKGRQELSRGYRKSDRAATKQLTKGKKALLGDYKSAETTVADTGPAGVSALGAAEQVERGDVNKALDASLGAVNQGYNTSVGAVNQGYGQGRADINQGYGQARGDITGARDTSLSYYDPYAQAGQAGSQSYADALGLNGQEGIARSQQQFQVGPGYQFAMDQGLTGIERTAAARGELGGGGTTLDQIKYSQGLANQEWQQYLSRLQGEQELGYNTAGAQANITGQAGTALSNLATGRAGALSGLDTGRADALSGLATGQGTALANLQTGAGQSLANINQQIATRQVAAATDAATKAAAIRQGMGEAKSAYYSSLANLDYSKYLGIAGARNQYQDSKDQTGANVFTGVTSAAKTASDLFKPTYSVAG